MARNKTVKVTMIDGTSWFIPPSEFNSFGVAEAPDSVIYNYIIGSRGSMLKGYTTEDFSGKGTFLNPKLIVSLDITYV